MYLTDLSTCTERTLVAFYDFFACRLQMTTTDIETKHSSIYGLSRTTYDADWMSMRGIWPLRCRKRGCETRETKCKPFLVPLQALRVFSRNPSQRNTQFKPPSPTRSHHGLCERKERLVRLHSFLTSKICFRLLSQPAFCFHRVLFSRTLTEQGKMNLSRVRPQRVEDQ